MRTSILASLLGLSLVACAGQIEGTGGDDDVPETCGDGKVDPGEECDGGEGCSASCTSEGPPRLDTTVDKPTVMTELGTNNMVTLTLTGANGFEGDVNVAASIVDTSMVPVDGWVAAVNQPVVSVPLNGTANVVASVTIPSNSTLLAANLKLDLTSSAGTSTVMSAVTALNQITFSVDISAATGRCTYSVDATPVSVKVGTLVRFTNISTQALTIHSNGGNRGIAHQADGPNGTPGTAPNETYSATPTSAGPAFTWYCHAPADVQNDAQRPKLLIE